MKSHASMNRIYRLVWNAALSLWVAVAENAKGRGKGGSVRGSVLFDSALADAAEGEGGGGSGFRLNTACRAALVLLASLAVLTHEAHAADAANASVSAGAAGISTVGNTTTINQSTQRVAIDWTSLSTAANEALRFNQPNAAAIALNRITGSSPSELLGSLTANGQVFILNPNGVLFGAGSQVNVGGLVASTLSMSNADFMAGNHVFSNNGASGSVVNQGTLTAAPGGYLALLAPEVRNEGVMTASLGTALLAAGNKVTLNLDNGSLLGYSIDQGALNALAENKQLIQADGGQVLLSAKAMDSLTTATVNNTGVIEARTIQNKAGRIMLMGDMETGTVNVAGTLDASAPNGGDGGFIETSASHVTVASGTRVTTSAPGGQTGKWLIDPNDFTIAASGGDMDAATVEANLASTNFEIQTATMGTAGGNGDIKVNQALSWSSANTLTLTAERNIEINQAIAAANGGLTLNSTTNGVISAPAAVNVGTFTLANGVWSQVGALPGFSATDFRIDGGTFTRVLGGDGLSAGTAYQLTDIYGLQGAGSAGMLDRKYTLANNVDASGTAAWNAGAGFKPIGTNADRFIGSFDGQGHTISSLAINRPSEDYVGLFGSTGSTGTVANVGLVGGSVIGHNYVGALVGANNFGNISNSHATGAVTGSGNTGGLVGGQDGGSINNSYATGDVRGTNISTGGLVGRQNNGNISNSYATGAVTGTYYIGGLVGYNDGSIDNSYATGAAMGEEIGGLAGYNGSSGSISNSHAIGGVTSTSTNAGGLVGDNEGHISHSYATGAVTGAGNVGGLVGLNNAGFIDRSYATGAVAGYDSVGGLVGGNQGSIDNSYATGAVMDRSGGTGGYRIGGLVGLNSSNIANSYATGAVTGTVEVGGLVGLHFGGSIDNSFWDTQTSGQASSDGGTGKTSAEMMQASTFTGAGWSASNVGGDGTTWRIYEGQTRPLLRSFLTALNLAPVYDGSGTALADIGAYTTPGGTDNTKLLGAVFVPGTLTLSSSGAAGNYVASASVGGYYSAQDGYDIYSSRTIATAGSTAGDVRVDNSVTWTSGTLNINAAGSVDLNGKNFNGGAAGRLNFNAGATITNAGSIDVGTFDLQSGSFSQVGALPTFSAADFRISGGTFVRALGGDGTSGNAYQLSDAYGLQGAGSAGMLNKNYVLANNVDASGTAGWNAGAGFKPIGYNGDPFSGSFDGQSHTISNLTINRPGEDWVGLFGTLGASRTVANVGLTGGSVAGSSHVGGLVGRNNGRISNSYATGVVTGDYEVGGLAGENLGRISNSYATGGVTGDSDVGGLAGTNYGDITDSYATGTVTATGFNGGLVGWNAGGSITNSYATGAVTGSFSFGGLVGVNHASITDSFWNTDTSGQSTSAGGTGKTTAEMMQASTFTGAGWSASNVGGDGTTWRIYEGQTGPLLRGFLTALNLGNTSVTYNGGTQAGVTTAVVGVSGSNASGRNAGSYNTGYYSNQQGYDIIGGGLDIARADLTLSTSNVTKTYDGTLSAAGTAVAAAGTSLLGGDTASGGSFAFTDKNAGTGNKTVTTTGVTVNDGNGGNNYNVSYVDNTTSTINKASLTVTATGVTKTYDGTTSATGTGTVAALAGAAAGEVVDAVGSQAFLDKNAGTGNKTVRASGVTIKDSGNADVTGNYTIAYVDDTASTINKANVTLSTSDVTKTYDGTLGAAGTVVVTAGTVFAGDNTTGGTFAFTSKNASTGNKIVTTAGVTVGDGVNNANYNVSYVANNTSTINQANLTVSTTNVTKTYDGTVAASGTATVVAGTVFSGDSLSGGSFAFTDKNAGTGNKTVTASGVTVGDGVNNANYNVTYADNTSSTINRANLTVTADAVTKTYDGTLNAAGSGSVGTLAGAGAGEVVNTAATQAFTDKNFGIGNKTVQASGLTIKDSGNVDVTGNYNISYVDNTASTINKANVTLSTSDVTKTYDGSLSATGTVVVTAGAIFSGDNATGGSFAFTDKNAGTGNKTVTTSGVTVGDGVNNANYNISYADNTSSTINQASLTVSTANVTKTYDGNTSAAGSATVTGGTLFGGDSLAGGSFAFTDKNAGNGNKTVQTSGVTVGDGVNNANYNVSYADNTTSTINPFAVSLSGTRSYDGTADVAAGVLSIGTLVAGETLGLTGTATMADKNVGANKALTVAGLSLVDGTGLASNYSFTGGTQQASITQASITVGSSNVSKTYDGNLSAAGAATVTAGTLFSGDSLTGGSFAFTDKNAGTGNKTVTTSGVTVGDGVNNGNYAVSYADNTTSTINRADLTVTATGVNKVYDGTTVAAVTYGDNRVAGDVVGITGSATFADRNAGVGKAVGVNGIALGGTDAGNYNLLNTSTTTTASITPKALTVTANGDTKLYDGSAYSGGNGVSYSGFVAGDSSADIGGALAYGGSSQGAIAAGSYLITPGGLSSISGNYALGFVDGALNITTSNASTAAVGNAGLVSSYDAALQAVAGLGASSGGGLGGGGFGGDAAADALAAAAAEAGKTGEE